jgi:hypothetical protein
MTCNVSDELDEKNVCVSTSFIQPRSTHGQRLVNLAEKVALFDVIVIGRIIGKLWRMKHFLQG